MSFAPLIGTAKTISYRFYSTVVSVVAPSQYARVPKQTTIPEYSGIDANINFPQVKPHTDSESRRQALLWELQNQVSTHK